MARGLWTCFNCGKDIPFVEMAMSQAKRANTRIPGVLANIMVTFCRNDDDCRKAAEEATFKVVDIE